MVTRSFLKKLLPYSGLERVHFANGNNGNIIKVVNSKLQRAIEIVAPVAPYFKGSTPEQTVKNVFDFLLTQITYKADGDNQLIKLPNALVNIGVGDCKSYTLFAAAVFSCLNIPCIIRYAGYKGTNEVSHVYPIANGIICDAVYKRYNQEAPYSNKKDFIIIERI